MFRKVVRIAIWVVVGVLGLFRFAADWVGRSTFWDDFTLLRERLWPMIEFVASQPAVPFYGALVLLALIGLSLHISQATWLRWLPWLSGVAGASPPNQEVLPGATIMMAVRLATQVDARRKYLATLTFDHGASASLYITADNRLVYAVTDHFGEVHSVNQAIDAKTLRYGEFTAINGGFGVAPSYSILSLWKDGECIESKRFPFPVRVEGIKEARFVVGADASGVLSANLDVGPLLWIGRTLSTREILLTTQHMAEKTGEGMGFLQFREGAHLATQSPQATGEEKPQ